MEKTSKNIIVLTWQLFLTPGLTWDKIASQRVTENEIRRKFVFPWIALCVATVAVFDSLYAGVKGLETGILNATITAISLIGGYYLANKICLWYLRRHLAEKFTSGATGTIVSYSFAIVFVLEIITTVLPGLFFLHILHIFIAYLVWEGCRAILMLGEEDRGNIILVFTVVIIFAPVLISRVIYLMLPNA